MAQTKITQLSKDFNIKSKDVIEIFKTVGFEKKSGATVEAEELEIFLSHMTRTHQITNIDAYTSGNIKIKVVSDAPKAEAAKEEKPAIKAEAAPKVKE